MSPAPVEASLESLDRALGVSFSDPDIRQAALTHRSYAFEHGTDALKKLRVANLWPVRTAGALARTAADVGGMVWSR